MTTLSRRFTEASEGAFSIEIPDGWEAQAGVVRVGDARPWYRARSVGGGAELRVVDPRWPLSFLDAPFGFMPFPMPGVVARGYVPPPPFAEEYAHAFSRERGARRIEVTSVRSAEGIIADDPRPDARARAAQMLQLGAELGGVEFVCPDANARGLVDVCTLRMPGPFGLIWTPFVTALMAPMASWPHALATMLHVVRSYRADPLWERRRQQVQSAQHEAAMESIRVGTAVMNMQAQSGMSAIQAHAQRAAISHDAFTSAGDAQVRGWQSQQASLDESHRRAVNVIREEVDLYDSSTNTVLRGAPAGFQSYWTDGEGVVASRGHESPDPTRMRPLEDLDRLRRG